MARHTDQRSGRTRDSVAGRIRAALPMVGICLLLIGAAVLAVWWWNIRSVTDPIDADPVDAYAVVVSSPPCSSGSETTVRMSGSDGPVTGTLSGCGFAKDQRLAVQYLAGHPQQMRLAGTSVASGSGLASKLLPIGILAAGLVAVLAALALVVERRRSRHLAAANRISVADLRSRAGEPDRAEDPAVTGAVTGIDGTPAVGVDGDTGDGDGAPAGGDGDAARPADAGEPDSGRGAGEGDDAPAPPGGVPSDEAATEGDDAGGGARPDAGAGGPDGVDEGEPGSPSPAEVDTGEPAHRLPSGFVIVDEQLFTHSGTEAPPDPDRTPD